MPTRISLRSFLLLFTIALAAGVHAQRAFLENIGVQHGLPASKVYALLEDEQGMIWIGTEAGISRLDGNIVTTYDQALGMAPNGVRCLFMDADQRIWAGHLGGGITVIENDKALQLKPGIPITSDISSIAQDEEGHIWLATYGQGAIRMDAIEADGTVKCTGYKEEHGIDPGLSKVLSLGDGTLVFIDASGSMFRLEGEGQFVQYVPEGLPAEELVITAYEDGKGDLWIGTRYGGGYKLDRKGASTQYHIGNGMGSNFVISFGEDAAGNVWLGTYDKGIGRVIDGKVVQLDESNGLHDSMVRCMIRDREGNMLIGTNINGLDIFKGERFMNFTEADGLADPQVWAVMEDRQGRMWMGTNGGITLWDPKSSSSRNITAQQGELNSNRIRSIKQDASGKIWIGSDNAGLFEFDANSFRSGYNPEVRVADGRVTAMEIGRQDELWIGSLDGLIRYRSSGPVMIYNTANGLSSGNIASLYMDPKGSLWVGTVIHGISRIDNGEARRIELGRQFTATCFVQDREGRMWIGTEGQGIILLENDRIVGSYTTDHGLLSNSIKALNIDGFGNIWIGTSRGLDKWIPGRDRPISYTDRSGYIGIETKPNATCLSRSGHIWFGTANGATRVATDAKADEVPAPLIALRGLRVNLEDRGFKDGMSFGHADNNIRIAYGSVSLSDPAAVQYAHMLDGIDPQWQPPTDATEAHYPALQPGDYVFKVKAMNRSGVWSDPPAEFHFSILPPWYRSWWFYTVLVATIGIVLFSYIKVREKQLRTRNLLLERKVQERTAEVVAQSKEIEGQKKEIEGLLLNILPKEISEELKGTGKATARRHDDVSVLFTDMKGFTKAAEKMSPEELVHELDECFIKFDEITARYGIEKIKTIGDSYMCASGVPSKDPHHAVKSVLAAMEVRELMDQWRREREALGKIPWILRIGIHTGPVVAGVVGRRKFAYDIWGDTVNTASRMESSGVPGEVNISGTTWSLINDYFDCEHRGQVEAKNKGRIDMYFVRRIKPAFSADPEGTRASRSLLSRLGMARPQEEFA